MRKFVILSVLAVLAVAGCSSSSGSDNVVYTSSASIALKPGQQATIKLEANATTGYEWTITEQPDTKVAKVTSNKYESKTSASGMVGVGGTQVLVIQGVAKGTTTLKLEYKRSFEADQPPANTATFPITVG